MISRQLKFVDFQALELGVEDHGSKSQWRACMGVLSNNAWEKGGTEDFSLGQRVGEDRTMKRHKTLIV